MRWTGPVSYTHLDVYKRQVLYLKHEAPPEEQNFAMVMEMLSAAEVREEDEEYESPLDILFARLEMRDPESIAVKQYHVFKMGAGKTLKSILISVGAVSYTHLPESLQAGSAGLPVHRLAAVPFHHRRSPMGRMDLARFGGLG